MGVASNYTFTAQDVAEALVKAQGLHEGMWSLRIGFVFGAGNVPQSPSVNILTPTAMVGISEFGLERVKELDNLSVDAKIVNPKAS